MAPPVNLHRIDLFSLSLFSLIVRTGSISKGAELASLAVGAASKRISDLEAAVGIALLERHSRGVVPTIAGHALQRHAQRILGDVDQLAADLSDYASGLVGVVRLWANTSAVTQFLPGDIAAFTRASPGIRIELEEEDSAEVVLAILDGRADLGIFADRTPTLGLHVMNYGNDQLALVVPTWSRTGAPPMSVSRESGSTFGTDRHGDQSASRRRPSRPARRRNGAADRRAFCRQDAGRVRGRGDQDRGARHRRPAAQLAAEALSRIGAMCACVPDLFGAMLAVLGTHQGVSRPILATAIKQFRRELDDHSREDVLGLLSSIMNGGRPGFDAVMRSRRKGERKALALSGPRNSRLNDAGACRRVGAGVQDIGL